MTSDASVFISYRRGDSADVCDRANEALTAAFGNSAVFRDIGSIAAGAPFHPVIVETLAKCKAALVMIGAQWINIQDANGNRRLDNPSDLVRIEIETALQDPRVRVIPVLVNNTPMPAVADLPPSLAPLCERNAVALRRDPDFRHDVEHLISELTALGVPRVANPAISEGTTSRSTTIVSTGPNAKIVGAIVGDVNFNE